MITIAFTENTNQSDEAILKMRVSVDKIAKKNNCKVIHGNKTTLLIENTNELFAEDLIDDVINEVSCDSFEIDFKNEEEIYRNFTHCVKVIGNALVFELLEAINYDSESLDYKAIACRNFVRFYE